MAHPYGGGGGYGSASLSSASSSGSYRERGASASGGSYRGSPSGLSSSMGGYSRAHSGTQSPAPRFLATRHPSQHQQHQGAGGVSGSGSGSGRAPLRKQRAIVVLGANMSGKTALCVRCVNERFEDAHEPTYENSFIKVFHHQGAEVECLIKDTQGVGEQEIFRNEYGLGVHGYVLVYSITSQRSFDIVQSINAKLISLMGTRHVPRVLVGNMLDKASLGLRQVSTEAGQELAASWGCRFLEVSAKNDLRCDRVFHMLLDEIDAINEPGGVSSRRRGLHDMQKCWRRFGCGRLGWGWCCSSDGGGAVDDDAEETQRLLSPPSSAQLGVAVERAAQPCKASTWAVMLMALCGMVAALIVRLGGFNMSNSGRFGVRDPSVGSSSDGGGGSDGDGRPPHSPTFSHVLFGCSLLVWLVSLVGLYALRASSPGLLFAYACALSLALLIQLCVSALLIAVMHAHLVAQQQWVTLLLLVALVAWAAQAYAAVAALRMARCVAASQAAASAGGGGGGRLGSGASVSPFSSDFHATYQSLYE